MLFQACTQSTSKDALVIAIESQVKNLDPRFATDAYSQRVVELIYNGLVKLDQKSNIVPDACERWEMPNDKTYVFHLRNNITFHDGKPLTVEDVRYTFESILSEETKSPFKAAFQKIKKIEILGPQTIQLTLDEPSAVFLTDLTVARIIPRHYDDLKTQALNNHPIGSGPYRFIKQDINKIELRTVENHFWKTPKLDKLIIKTVLEDTTRVALLRKKEVDLVQNALPSTSLSQFQKLSDFMILQVPSLSYKYLGFNLKDPILKNLKVRQAIAHAINIKEIIQYGLDGLAIEAVSLLSPESPYFEKDVPKYPFDLKKAQELLDKAGYPKQSQKNERFKLEFKTSTNPEAVRITKMIANQLRKVDINVEVLTFEFGTFYEDIKKGNFQMFSLQRVGITEPDVFYNSFHSAMTPPNGDNRGFYKNSFVDQLLEKGRKTVEPEKRKPAYSRLQKIIAEELPYVHLWHPTYFAVANKNVKGLVLWSTGSFIPLVDCYK